MWLRVENNARLLLKGNISSGFIQGAEFHEPKRPMCSYEELCFMEVMWLDAFGITVKNHFTKFLHEVLHRIPSHTMKVDNSSIERE